MFTRRRSSRFVSLFVSLLILLSGLVGASGRALATTPTPDWVPVGRPDFSGAAGYYPSIALDAQDVAYVAYMDFAHSNKLTVMKHPGPGPDWSVVGAPGFSAGQVRSVRMVLDGQGLPWVAYSDFTTQYRITVMKFDGTAWSTVGFPGFSDGDVDAVNLAIDGGGTPYVAYLDNSFAGRAVVMKFSGSSWLPIGAPGFSPTATYLSLALNGSGTPYVAFDDGGNSSRETVMTYTATGGWQNVGAAGFTANRAGSTSVAIDSTGAPYVAFADWITSSTTQTSVMRYDAAAGWQRVGTTSFGVGPVHSVGLKIGSDDKPLVVFQDDALARRDTVMRFDGSSWLAVGARGFTPGQADNPTMVLDAGNNPYVAFTDWKNGGKASAMRYSLDGKVMPLVTMTVAPGYVPAASGWYNRTSGTSGISVNVTAYSPYGILSVTCTDNGLAVLDTGMETGAFLLGDGDHKVTCVAGDGAGTTGAGPGSTAMPAAYPVDQTPPAVAPIVSPNPVVIHGAATVISGAEDNVSGIASQSCGALDTNSLGTKSVSCTAVDIAGNPAGGSTTYVVQAVVIPPTATPPPTSLPPGSPHLYLPLLKR